MERRSTRSCPPPRARQRFYWTYCFYGYSPGLTGPIPPWGGPVLTAPVPFSRALCRFSWLGFAGLAPVVRGGAGLDGMGPFGRARLRGTKSVLTGPKPCRRLVDSATGPNLVGEIQPCTSVRFYVFPVVAMQARKAARAPPTAHPARQ